MSSNGKERSLLEAAADGDIYGVRLALKRHKGGVDGRDGGGRTALMLLASINCDAAMRFVLEAGAAVDEVDAEASQTALHIAGMVTWRFKSG